MGSSPTVVVGASDLPKPFHKNPELHKGRSASSANAARYRPNSDLQLVYPLGCEGRNKDNPGPFSFGVCVSVVVPSYK